MICWYSDIWFQILKKIKNFPRSTKKFSAKIVFENFEKIRNKSQQSSFIYFFHFWKLISIDILKSKSRDILIFRNQFIRYWSEIKKSPTHIRRFEALLMNSCWLVTAIQQISSYLSSTLKQKNSNIFICGIQIINKITKIYLTRTLDGALLSKLILKNPRWQKSESTKKKSKENSKLQIYKKK